MDKIHPGTKATETINHVVKSNENLIYATVPINIDGKKTNILVVSEDMNILDEPKIKKLLPNLAILARDKIMPEHKEGFSWGDCDTVAYTAKKFLEQMYGEFSQDYDIGTIHCSQSASTKNLLHDKGHDWHMLNIIEVFLKKGSIFLAVDFTANHNLDDYLGNYQIFCITSTSQKDLEEKVRKFYKMKVEEIKF